MLPSRWSVAFAVSSTERDTTVCASSPPSVCRQHGTGRLTEASHHVVLPSEPCQAALAAVLAGKVALGEATLVTLSGGNVDPELYAEIIAG